LKSALSERIRARAGAALPALGTLLLVAMAGSLWTVGYLVAPTLFAMLEREQAGRVAGQLFTQVAWLVMICTAVLLGFKKRLLPGSPRWISYGLLGVLALAAVGHFALRPYLAGLREALAAGRVAQETYHAAFGRAHGISALLYLAQSFLAAALAAGCRRGGT
jgi:hypothetical protein